MVAINIPHAGPIEFAECPLGNEASPGGGSIAFTIWKVTHGLTLSTRGLRTRLQQMNVSSNENVTYYTAGTINGDVLTLTSAEEVPAGTPAICKFGSEGSNTITAANVNVVTGVQTESVTDDAITLIGSFTAKTIDATATTDNVYAISGGKFVRATKTLNLKPFRAYFTTSGSAPSNGFSIAVDDDSITAINALTGEGEVTIASIYSADGKQVNDLQPGLNIVKLSNGKVQKILVR